MLNYPPLPLPGGEYAAPAVEVIPLLGGVGVGFLCQLYHEFNIVELVYDEIRISSYCYGRLTSA